jgi:hypothetical protein
MALLTESYADKIVGTLSCFDRVIIAGSLIDIAYAEAMAKTLRIRGTRLFDYARFAEPLRDEVRTNAERLAAENGLTVEYIQKKNFRMEERVKAILKQRGDHPGLVHIYSVIESCPSFRPWHDKKTGQTYLKGRMGQCLHYYFYFVDEQLGLCYLRVPTWAPFRLQFYFNGHSWLARQLDKKGIGYTLQDNAFLRIDYFSKAQTLVDQFDVKKLHRRLDQYARKFCPVVGQFPGGIHWSLTQIEYATDIVFRTRQDLQLLYEPLVRTAIHAVKAENVATFLGRKLHPHFAQEAGNDFHTRIEGTRIRHHFGTAALKMYDKHGSVLRLETTVNDVTFFKHHRKVEHRSEKPTMQFAPVRKTIYSLGVMAELLQAANRRYLEFLSALDLPGIGIRQVAKVARPVREDDRNFPGFNLFHGEDLDLFRALVRGEFAISGFRNSHLQPLVRKNPSQVSRILKRLRLHGIVKKIGRTYKYYLTTFGQAAAACALRLHETVVLPAFAHLSLA